MLEIQFLTSIYFILIYRVIVSGELEKKNCFYFSWKQAKFDTTKRSQDSTGRLYKHTDTVCKHVLYILCILGAAVAECLEHLSTKSVVWVQPPEEAGFIFPASTVLGSRIKDRGLIKKSLIKLGSRQFVENSMRGKETKKGTGDPTT